MPIHINPNFQLIAPNGNSSLCLWGGKELHSVTIGGGHSVLCKGDIYSYIDDLLSLDNSCNFGKNLQEEPISEDLNTELDKYIKEHFTIDKEQLDRLGLEEKDYMYSMDKSDMLILSSHFANWQKENLWKSADGDDLPIIDREVIALVQDYPDDKEHLRVVFAHRPSKYAKVWNSDLGEEQVVEIEGYGKGGWNIQNVKYWLDCSLPNMEED